MKKLLNADDFTKYCQENQTGNESWPGMMNKHFKIIENSLLNDEYGLTSFMLMIGNSSLRIAGVLTNKRLIIGQKKVIGNQLITISINNINDIYTKKGIIDGILIIDSLKEKIELHGLKQYVQNTYKYLHESLDDIKSNVMNGKNDNGNSKYDDLKKLKDLLDNKVISQKEFEKEKNKILNQ